MAKKEQEPKQILEREYIVPLRKGWLKVPKYKRTNKAVKTLKEFLARHMKIYDNDLRKIKIDIILNNEIRFRGIKKPPARIKVRAKKFEDGIVRVELVDIPKHIVFARIREMKKSEVKKKVKKEEKVDEDKSEENKKEDKKEEAASSLDVGKSSKDDSEIVGKSSKDDSSHDDEGHKKKEEKIKAKDEVKIKPKQDQKHVSKDKDVRIQRKALSR